MILDITDKIEFNKILESNELVIVDFWATWCGPCRMLGSVIGEYSNDKPDAILVKVNVDEANELASEYDIQSLPTIMIFKNGEGVASKVGFMSKSAFEKYIENNR